MAVLVITYVASLMNQGMLLSNVKVCIVKLITTSDVSFVLCIVYIADCTDEKVRLQDGTDPSNGGVEVCKDGMWASVCSNTFDPNEAVVVCRQLGYNSTEGTSMQLAL